MDKKRPPSGDIDTAEDQPSTKVARTASATTTTKSPMSGPAVSSSPASPMMSPTGGESGGQNGDVIRDNGANAIQNEDSPDDGNLVQDPTNDSLVKYQRAQLAARITEQTRDILWLREKVNELQKLVAVLDAAPRAALYHMCAVREDLSLTLQRLGLAFDVNAELAAQCPIAATLLDAEIVTNDSLAEMPASLKKLTTRLILAMEQRSEELGRLPDSVQKEANDEIHTRLRQVSDQLERYAERDKQSLVSSTTFRDEYDDLREEASLQRRKIVALEKRLQEKLDEIARLEAKHSDDDRSREDGKSSTKLENGMRRSCDSLPHGSVDPSGGRSSSYTESSLRELAEKRLRELHESHAEIKRLVKETEGLKAEINRRDCNILPTKNILNTALFQTMEATTTQLYIKEKTWLQEREAQKEELEAERKEAREKLEHVKSASEKVIDDLRKQVDEMRRVADAAKVEKDKVVMTYESRKMEGNATSVIAAAEKRARTSDEVREKLSKTNETLTKEANSLRTRVRDLENQLKESLPADVKKMIDDLQKEVEEERAKSTAFIQEVESLSNMFGETEGENKRLVKLLAEKETVLSRVLAERLRGRQLLTTIREENRALIQGREMDAEKIKHLNSAVEASKQVAQEASTALAKAQEESRTLAATLEKRRKIADEATVKSASMIADKEEMKRERDALLAKTEKAILDYKDNRFEVERLHEKLGDAEAKIKKLETALEQEKSENGKALEEDSVRDEIIRDLNKKLNCSVVTNHPKEVVLLRCGHLFSRQCTDNLISSRNRKCPICGKPFGNDDVRNVFF